MYIQKMHTYTYIHIERLLKSVNVCVCVVLGSFQNWCDGLEFELLNSNELNSA